MAYLFGLGEGSPSLMPILAVCLRPSLLLTISLHACVGPWVGPPCMVSLACMLVWGHALVHHIVYLPVYACLCGAMHGLSVPQYLVLMHGTHGIRIMLLYLHAFSWPYSRAWHASHGHALEAHLARCIELKSNPNHSFGYS